MSETNSQICDRLWQRMTEKGDFPSLSETVQGIVEAMRDEEQNTNELAGAVLSDFALTQKVLRLANSPMYAAFGGNITTVTKAVMVLGQEVVGHLALSLRLLDSLGQVPAKASARTELAKAVLAGQVAREVAVRLNAREAEEGVVCALMKNLGRLLVSFYFPEEWSEIQALRSTGASEQAASEQVLGITLEALGADIAQRWKLPSKIVRVIAAPPLIINKDQPLDHHTWLQAVANFSTESAKAIYSNDGAAVQTLAAAYGEAFALSAGDLNKAVEDAVHCAAKAALTELAETPAAPAPGKPDDALQRLANGFEDIAAALQEKLPFNKVIQLVLETMHTSLGFKRTLLFLRDPQTRQLRARAGFGEGMPGRLPEFCFEEEFAPDVFHIALSKAADVFIEDASDRKILTHLPAWFRQAAPDARSFIILPLAQNGRAFGMLYGEWAADALSSRIEPQELAVLKSLRNQALQALGRQYEVA